VYGSARPSYLKILAPIHNHALRLCLGAFRTSAAVSLCVQATEPPLVLRRIKLSLQYCLKLSANTNNPAYNAAFNSKFKTQFDNKPSQIRLLGFRVEDDLQNLGFKKKNVLPTTVSTIPPWLLKRLNCNFSLCCYDNTTTNSEVFKRKFFELRSKFSRHVLAMVEVVSCPVAVVSLRRYDKQRHGLRRYLRATLGASTLYVSAKAVQVGGQINIQSE